MHGRLCHLFLNGVYWGIYDLAEPLSRAWAKDSFGGRAKQFFSLRDNKAWAWRMKGDATEFNATLQSAAMLPHAAPAVALSLYLLIASRVDLSNWVDYILIAFFIGKTDWPTNSASLHV